MKLLLDTSAVNALLRETDPDVIVSALHGAFTIRISSVSVAEVLRCPGTIKRECLRQLLRRLSPDFDPLELPDRLLAGFARAHRGRETRVLLSVSEDWRHLKDVLDTRNTLSAKGRDALDTWHAGIERNFTECHRAARAAFEPTFRDDRSLRPRNAAAALRWYARRPDFAWNAVSPLYEQATGAAIAPADTEAFLRSAPTWMLFRLGWAYAAYARAIRTSGFSPSKNAGAFDLYSAAYLPLVAVFVTDDRAQYHGLRLLSRFCPNRPHVRLYSHFRAAFLPLGESGV